MSEKLCGTCRWFDAVGRLRRFGECRVVVLGTESRRPLSEKAWLAGSDYAHLSVRKDFGCVLHEPRPPADRPAGG